MSTHDFKTDENVLAYLDDAMFRFLSTNSDTELQSVVARHLCSCLVYLGSSQDGVRKKVMELLVHLNKRIRNNKSVLLPIDDLIKLYKDPSSSSFVINFTIIYIKMGLMRLPVLEQTQLLPSLIASLDDKPASHVDSIFFIILPILGNMASNASSTLNNELSFKNLGLDSNNSKIANSLRSFLSDFLLLPYGCHPSLKATEVASDVVVPPGLSQVSWQRVAGETPIDSAQLERLKVGIVKFLCLGYFKVMDVALHLLIALSDTRHSVVSQADTELRKLGALIDWDNTVLVKSIYFLFIGSSIPNSTVSDKSHARMPANTRIRLKLMTYLLKSSTAPTNYPYCLLLVLDILFGTQSSSVKLKSMAVTFIHRMISNFSDKELAVSFGVKIMNALNRVLSATSSQPNEIRSECYVALGKLCCKAPTIISGKSVSVLQILFQAMSEEDYETQTSVQEALITMTPCFTTNFLNENERGLIEAVLMVNIERLEHSRMRHVSVHYAGEVFDLLHIPSRYILLIGAGDQNEGIATKAKKYLYGPFSNRTLNNNKSVVLPSFPNMLNFIWHKHTQRLKSKGSVITVGNYVLGYSPSVYVEIINYLRICLMYSATGEIGDDSVESILFQPYLKAPIVSKYMQTLNETDSSLTLKFIEFTDKLLASSPNLIQVARCLLQLIGCSKLTSVYVDKISWLKSILGSNQEEIREIIAQLIAFVLFSLPVEHLDRQIDDLCLNLRTKTIEYQHGVALTFGYIFGRILLFGQRQYILAGGRSYLPCVQLLISHISEPGVHVMLTSASCLAIGEMGRCGPLPIDDPSKLSLVNTLLELIKRGSIAMKVRERSAVALGFLCVGEEPFPHVNVVIQGLLNLAPDIKDLELQFTIGEALVFAVMGFIPQGKDIWTDLSQQCHQNVNSLNIFQIERLINDLTMNCMCQTNPNVKQSSCLWLLALLKKANEHPTVTENLPKIQKSFLYLLGDSADIVQDAASKGLGLVYEYSNELQRSFIVDSLLGSLLDTSQVVKVTPDTKIFQEGEMGPTPLSVGGNLTTYKELCALATDLQQPDLIYKFMNLANYNAGWNSRRGAAFGFSNIAIQAGKFLEPYLPRLVPKLFRYRFDPTPRVQQSMSAIWAAIVPDSNKIVDLFLKDIMVELQNSLTSNHWRVRESCCVALQDVLRSRSLDNTMDLFPLILRDLFRLMDDIKESVRIAAASTLEVISRVCTNLCDSTTQGVRVSQEAIKLILPPFLEIGLISNVFEVRLLTLQSLIKISRNAGILLKPHLHVFIPALLEATSELEGKDVNHLSSMLAADHSFQEKFDSARISAVKTSNSMKCITFVLQYVDQENLPLLISPLIQLIKHSPALSTKGATAHVIGILTHQCPLYLEPFSAKLLTAFLGGLSDRNPSVRKSYSKAIGCLLKTAKASSIEKLFIKLRKCYLENEDSSPMRSAVALTMEAVSQQSPDVIMNHGSLTLPLIFLAMQQQDTNLVEKEIIDTWREIWNESTPGTEGGIRLYLAEIISFAFEALNSARWNLKAQGARAFGAIAVNLGKMLPSVNQRELLVMLIKALSGRTWTGKESVLEAIVKVCQSAPDNLIADLSAFSSDSFLSMNQLISCLTVEYKKGSKLEYKTCAIRTAGIVFGELKIDVFADFYSYLKPFIDVDNCQPEENDDSEEDDSGRRQQQQLDLQFEVMEAIGNAWPVSTDCSRQTQNTWILDVILLLGKRIQVTTLKNQAGGVACLAKILLNWQTSSAEQTKEIFSQVASILAVILPIGKYPSLRIQALNLLSCVICKLTDLGDVDINRNFYEIIGKALDYAIREIGLQASLKAQGRSAKSELLRICNFDITTNNPTEGI